MAKMHEDDIMDIEMMEEENMSPQEDVEPTADELVGCEVSDEDLEADVKEVYVETTASTDPVKAYLKQIGQYKLLTKSEIQALIEKGDKDSKNKIITHNLRLAFHVAKGYQGRGVPLLDLVQEANLGLVKAVDRFKPDMGYAFSTYATWWCTAAVRRYIQDSSSTMRLPVYMVENITKIRNAIAEYEKSGLTYTNEDLSGVTGLSVKAVKKALEAMKYSEVLSLDYTDGDDESSNLGKTVADSSNVEDNFMETERNSGLVAILDKYCNERERDIVLRHFGFTGKKETFDDLAAEYGVSKQRINQIFQRAMEKLKNPAVKLKIREIL